MINKLYSKFKEFIKENVIFIIITLVLISILNIPLPYYIETSGGIINTEDRLVVNNGYSSLGSINLTYVSEIKGNVFTYVISKFNKNWDLISSKSDTTSNHSKKTLRNKILLNNSLSNATYAAYKFAEKDIKITESNIYVVYIDAYANTDLEVGDIIKSVNSKKIKTIDEYKSIVSKSNILDKLELIVNDNEKKYIEVKEYNNTNNTYVYLVVNNSYDKNDVIFNFKEGESGPSAGFMIALSLYNKLTPYDLTKGNAIAGTGTIDLDGNVGAIDGVKYKLRGAVKNNVDIFFVPTLNYEDALKEKNTNNYDIEIVKIEKFEDAILYLKEKE